VIAVALDIFAGHVPSAGLRVENGLVRLRHGKICARLVVRRLGFLGGDIRLRRRHGKLLLHLLHLLILLPASASFPASFRLPGSCPAAAAF
jgi:hypothetical protein